MLLAVLSGCKNPSGAVDNGGNGGNTDNTTITAPIQITTTIHEIAKHGNLVLYMYGSDLYDKGFEHGDIVEIAIGDKKWDVPLCTSYSDVDNGETVLRAIGETDGVVLAINMGDFATTAGIAQKTAIDEEPGYRWDYLMESPVEITITMKEEGGYANAYSIDSFFVNGRIKFRQLETKKTREKCFKNDASKLRSKPKKIRYSLFFSNHFNMDTKIAVRFLKYAN